MINTELIRAFALNQAKNPESFCTIIHPDDEMFLFDLPSMKNDADRTAIHYMAQGRQIRDNLAQIIDWHFGGFGNIGKLMDFACGYGRLARYLVQEMPPERIWVSDIYDKAVAFLRSELKVNGIVSTHQPEDYPEAGPFDCIYVGSLFSHLPENTFSRWLERLYRMLTPRGLLIYSVLDEAVMAPGVKMNSKGHLFSTHSESQTLDTSEYGVAFVTEAFVKAQAFKVTGRRDNLHRLPKGLAGHQDLYLLSPSALGDVTTLKYAQNPVGWVELCRRQGNALDVAGWAADPNNAGQISKVEIFLDNNLVGVCLPSVDRPDVAAHLHNPAIVKAGWHCRVDLPSSATNGIVVVRATGSQSLQRVIGVSRP